MIQSVTKELKRTYTINLKKRKGIGLEMKTEQTNIALLRVKAEIAR